MPTASKPSRLSFLDILNYARDSQLTTGASQSLLYHLILRCDLADHSCYPSLALLVRDTGLGLSTVRTAARDLQTRKIVRRVTRYKHSTIWYVNVRLLQETAEANRTQWAAQDPAKQKDKGSPFEAPHAPGTPLPAVSPIAAPSPAAPQDATAELDAEPRASRPEQDKTWTSKLLDLLRKHLSGHPTYAHPDAEAIMSSAVARCIKLADGDAESAFYSMLRQLELEVYREVNIKALMGADRLGGYLVKCFPQWLAERREWVVETRRGNLLSRCVHPEPSELCDSLYDLDELAGEEAFTRAELGDALLEWRVGPAVGNKAPVYCRIAPEVRVAYILSRFCDVDVRREDARPEMLAAVLHAVRDESWSEQLRQADDPLRWYREHEAELLVEMGSESAAPAAASIDDLPDYEKYTDPPVHLWGR